MIGTTSPGGQRARIRAELAAESPLTSAQLSIRTGLPGPIVAARIRELVERGRIVNAGMTGEKLNLWRTT